MFRQRVKQAVSGEMRIVPAAVWLHLCSPHHVVPNTIDGDDTSETKTSRKDSIFTRDRRHPEETEGISPARVHSFHTVMIERLH